MTVAEAIYIILSNADNITSIVDDRIYPLNVPDGIGMPYVTYQLISNQKLKNKDRETSWQEIRLQIDCYADHYDQVTNLADAVSDVLSYYSGNVDDVSIDVITFEDENDLSELNPETYRKEQDYKIIINK